MIGRHRDDRHTMADNLGGRNCCPDLSVRIRTGLLVLEAGFTEAENRRGGRLRPPPFVPSTQESRARVGDPGL